MATNTYEAIATQTLGSTASTVTFSSIPSTYTDLILVANNVVSTRTASQDIVIVRFNSDTGTNYSATQLDGSSGGGTSTRWTNETSALMGFVSDSNSTANPSLFPSQFTLEIQNYSNSTTYKTMLCRYGENTSNNTYSRTGASVGLWRSNTAINTITLGLYYSAYAAGSTFSLYGIKSASATSPKATGGTIYEDSTYWYHAFAASGTFTPNQSLTCDYLVVAGGGGGGWAYVTGGGGAGGLRSTVTATGGGGSLETPLSLSATNYTVTIGAGGAGSTGSNPGRQGLNGSNSVFSTITSTGGGGGGGNAAGSSGTDYNGVTGGSGGGGGNNAASVPGSGTTNQGFAGGINVWDGTIGGGGGGGGAGAVGAAGSTASGGIGGNGGSGVTTLISGVSTVYAGGGGGGSAFGYTSVGGIGGGGAGGSATVNAISGTAGRGAGGGGAGGSGAGPNAGGNGGSGIVILRYLKA